MEKKVYYNNIKKNEKQKKLIKLLIVAVIISIVLLCFCFVFIKKQNELNNIQIFQIVFQNQKNGTVYFYSKKSLKNINIIQSQEADNIIYIEQTFFISFIDKDKIYIIIEDILKKDIEAALKSYPKFRDELFDKLYSFFSRYFTESGSIYFNSTLFYNEIYRIIYE